MAGATIKLTPEILDGQAESMKTLAGEYETLFVNVDKVLGNVNRCWSVNLANNFGSKITMAKNSFSKITTDLNNGARAAKISATTFQTIDSQLSKLYNGEAAILDPNAAIAVATAKEKFESIAETVIGDFEGTNYIDLLDDAKSAGEALGAIEEFYGNLPDLLTHGVEVLLPSSLKHAYTLTSGILQGDLTPKEVWSATTSILKKNKKLAVVCEAINYALDRGKARDEKMQQEVISQLKEGDFLGAGVDLVEGFCDTIIGGSIEVAGDVVGGLLDATIKKTKILKPINNLIEYGTGVLGINDGKGYSIGGLIGAGAEVISDGIDATTDLITDVTDVVTDAVTGGFKAGVKWVKSWFK